MKSILDTLLNRVHFVEKNLKGILIVNYHILIYKIIMYDNQILSGIFQMEILRQIQTGNPLIDAILFSILTYAVSKLLHNGMWKDWREVLRQFTNKKEIRYTIERQQNTGSVEKYNGDDKVVQEKNPLYYALAWYLRKAQRTQENAKSYRVIVTKYTTNGLNIIRGSTLNWGIDDDIDDDDDENEDGATRSYHNECVLIPTAKITIIYDDIIIKGEYERQEDDKGKEIKDGFVLSVDEKDSGQMTKFFQTIIDQHTKHVDIMTKGQKLYSLTTDTYSARENQYWVNTVFSSFTVLKNVVLKDKQQINLERDVLTFLKSRELYRNHGKVWKRGYLFYGPPGTGKTSLVKGIATITKYNIYNVKLSRFNSDEKMEALLRQIPSKSIVLFEDVDCMGNIAHKRSEKPTDDGDDDVVRPLIQPSITVKSEPVNYSDGDDTVKIEMSEVKQEKPTLNTLLNFIDGINSPEGIIVVMTTNHMEKLDPALLRDGRIDFRLLLSFCNRQQIVDLANNFFNVGMNVDDIIGIEEDALSPATVSRIMMEIAFKKKMEQIPLENIKDEIILELMRTIKDENLKNTLS